MKLCSILLTLGYRSVPFCLGHILCAWRPSLVIHPAALICLNGYRKWEEYVELRLSDFLDTISHLNHWLVML